MFLKEPIQFNITKMVNILSTESIWDILESYQNDKVLIEILQYRQLSGAKTGSTAEKLFYLHQSNIKLKQVKITLKNGAIRAESGALHFLKGNISIKSKMGGKGGLFKKALTSAITKEKLFQPFYEGDGEIYLEPSFGHFIIGSMNSEDVVIDKGLFYCCESSIETGIQLQKNLSSGLFGKEGWFQTKLSGTGTFVINSPVPFDEIIKISLNNERLQVDGNFALLRRGNIVFSVKKSTKSIFGSLTSGEGLLQTFEGTGEVWLAPTESIYEKLRVESLKDLMEAQYSYGTNTKQ